MRKSGRLTFCACSDLLEGLLDLEFLRSLLSLGRAPSRHARLTHALSCGKTQWNAYRCIAQTIVLLTQSRRRHDAWQSCSYEQQSVKMEVFARTCHLIVERSCSRFSSGLSHPPHPPANAWWIAVWYDTRCGWDYACGAAYA